MNQWAQRTDTLVVLLYRRQLMKISTLAKVILVLSTATALHADYNVNALVARASRNAKDAPLMVATAVKDNPKELSKIVTGVVKAFPDKAVDIVDAILVLNPTHAAQIVKAAIAAQPSLAIEITTAAVNTVPASAEAIIAAAGEVAPKEDQAAIAGITVDNPETAYATPSAPRSPVFPDQSLRPEVIISPSS